MSAPRPAVTVLIALLALSGCSGGSGSGSVASSRGPASTTIPNSPTATGVFTPAAPTRAGATSVPGTATSGPPAVRPRATSDSQQQRIVALQTEGGVPSLVIRLTSTGTVPKVTTSTQHVGQTLRMIVVSPVATHLIGKGLGVDVDVPAEDPVAVDVVALAPGSYEVTTTTGGPVARFLVAT